MKALELRSILWGVFTLIIRKKKKERKKKEKEKKTKNAESMDRSCKFKGVVSQKLERTLLFMWLQ